MPRWITVRERFDYRWPDRPAVTNFPAGEHFVKDEVADFGVGKGYAVEGRLDGSEARSAKSGPARRAKKGKRTAKAADSGPSDRVDQPDLAAPDRADDRDAVADPAG